MNRSSLFKLVVAALLLVAGHPSRAAAQAYDITADIPNLSGSYYYYWYYGNFPTSISDTGKVTGWGYNSTGYQRAFLFDGTQTIDLGTLGGGYSNGQFVNSAGHVVGSSTNSSGTSQAFLYNGGALIPLALTSGGWSYATAMNASSHVIGYGQTSSGSYQAFVYRGSASGAELLSGLLTVSGYYIYEAIDINDDGKIAAYGYGPSGQSRALLLTPSGSQYAVTEIAFSATQWSYPRAINAAGQVVGYGQTSAGYQHAFLYTAGSGTQDLGTLGGLYSEAVDLNDSGQVVGWAQRSDGNYRTFLYTAGTIQEIGSYYPQDINNLGQVMSNSWYLYSGGQWRYLSALVNRCGGVDSGYAALNNSGVLALRGYRTSEYRAFLASPVSGVATSTLEAYDSWGTYGGTISVAARLWAACSYLAGEQVEFSILGNSAGSATTDTWGYAYIPAASLAGVEPGDYPTGLGASFAGNATASAAADTARLYVDKRYPVLSWTPGSLIEGTPLGSLQLNATADVPGTFTYNPAAGAALTAGLRYVYAYFEPSDTVHYHYQSASTVLAVRASAPAVSFSAAEIPGLGGSWLDVHALNDSGKVVGRSARSTGPERAFMYSAGVTTDLGTLGGSYDWSMAVDVNNAGQVVGNSYNAAGYHRAFLYSGGVMTDLGALPGSYYSQSTAVAVNESGQVAGWSHDSSGYQRAFLYSGGIMTNLGTLPGAYYSYATALNDAGQVVGRSYDGSSERAFLFTAGVLTDLGTLGGSHAYPTAINASGHVVGYSYTAGNAAQHAFLYKDGAMIDIGTLGGTWSQASDINDAGEITGWSYTAGNAAVHGFKYSGGTMTDLGALHPYGSTQAYAINASGKVVGYTHNSDGQQVGFLHTGGAMHDLNALIDENEIGAIQYTRLVNDPGQIAGTSYWNGQTRAFLLTPKTLETSSITTAPAAGPRNGTTNLTATLQSAGAALEGYTVYFKLNGVSAGSAVTNAAGVAALTGASLSGIAPGDYASGVSATFAGAGGLSGSSATAALHVDKAVPTLEWATPGAILYGTALGTSQLNASASVGGTFAYSPANGAVLGAGTHTLNVTFTPTDTTTYQSATAEVTLSVLPAPLTITAHNKSKVYGPGLPALTAAYSGLVNGDLPAGLDTPVTLNTTATAASGVGTYPITASGAADANYTIGFVNGTLTVTAAALTIVADDKSMLLNGTLPDLTVSYIGFTNGDTAASLTQQPTVSTTATGGTPGAFAITPSGASSPNYTIGYTPGTLSVLFATGACLGQPGHVVLQPIDASGSVFKKGSTVPVKFRVCDAAGQSVAAGVVKSFVQFKVVAGTEVLAITEDIISTTPDTTFRWDATAQQWIFNVNTKNLVLNKTYYYRITLMDNSIIEFHFGVR